MLRLYLRSLSQSFCQIDHSNSLTLLSPMWPPDHYQTQLNLGHIYRRRHTLTAGKEESSHERRESEETFDKGNLGWTGRRGCRGAGRSEGSCQQTSFLRKLEFLWDDRWWNSFGEKKIITKYNKIQSTQRGRFLFKGLRSQIAILKEVQLLIYSFQKLSHRKTTFKNRLIVCPSSKDMRRTDGETGNTTMGKWTRPRNSERWKFFRKRRRLHASSMKSIWHSIRTRKADMDRCMDTLGMTPGWGGRWEEVFE